MISQMTRWCAPALLPLLLAACSTSPAPQAPPGELGRRFTATIPGSWTGTDSSGGFESRMIKRYNRDGTAQGVLLGKKKGPGISFVMPEIPFKSRWRVTGDVVETYDIRSGFPGLFKPGEVIRDTIVSVSPDRITYRSDKSGKIQVINRLNSSR